MGTGGRTLLAAKLRQNKQWWIERENGDRISGPFTTIDDAHRARDWVERVLKPETFWIRSRPPRP